VDIQFLGATRTVTGSSYLLRFNDKQVLIDCGLFQGGREMEELNYLGFHYAPRDIDYVLLTHAHIDHSGLIPRLYKLGFNGKVVTTHATKDLCSIMLPDSGYLQEEASITASKHRQQLGKLPRPPLYTRQDAEVCLKSFQSVDYDKIIDLDRDLSVRFRDAGHILGSAYIEVWAQEGPNKTLVLFSGDQGQTDQPIIKDPTMPTDCAPDYMLIESTYGAKMHEDFGDRAQQLIDAIKTTQQTGGKLIIPAFSVGRTQNLLYYINEALVNGKMRPINVYVDSPLAIGALEIYARHTECFDPETVQLIKTDSLPLDFEGLTLTKTSDQSKKINEDEGPAVIIAASGMCEGGRIRHHLKHNIWKKETTMLFVSFQAEGTLGRRILDGEKEIYIFGEQYHVAAKVMQITGFSAHADQEGLVQFASKLKAKPKTTFIVHGELDNAGALADELVHQLDLNIKIPQQFEHATLSGGRSR
jgi:metallo-beta-lactamase family protein